MKSNHLAAKIDKCSLSNVYQVSSMVCLRVPEIPPSKWPSMPGKIRHRNSAPKDRRVIWQWLKTTELGLRRFGSMFPPTRVPFWYRFFEPYPYVAQNSAIGASRRVWSMFALTDRASHFCFEFATAMHLIACRWRLFDVFPGLMAKGNGYGGNQHLTNLCF